MKYEPRSPVVKLLLVQEFSPFVFCDLRTELGVLEQLEVVESVGVPDERRQSRIQIRRALSREDALYESCVVLLFPVEKVLEVVQKSWLIQNSLLCQGMQVVRVRESLDEFQLKLEANAIRCLGLVDGRLRHSARSKRWHVKIRSHPRYGLSFAYPRGSFHWNVACKTQKRNVTRRICHPTRSKLSHLNQRLCTHHEH